MANWSMSRCDSSLALQRTESSGSFSFSLCTSVEGYLQRDVIDLDIIGAPLAEEFDLRGLSHSGGSLPLSHCKWSKHTFDMKRGSLSPKIQSSQL